jgi:hypothetical protein
VCQEKIVRKNDRKKWSAFLKENSLLKNDFSKDYYLEYTLFIEFVNYLVQYGSET